MPELELDDQRAEELRIVYSRRYIEARLAGLEHSDADRFADSLEDIGHLRRCVKGACPHDLIRRIFALTPDTKD